MNREPQQLRQFHHQLALSCNRPNGLRLRRMLRDLPYLERHFVGPRRAWLRVLMMSAVLTLFALTQAVAAQPAASYEAGLQAASEHRYATAMENFQRAAELGNREAMRNLGLMLWYGEALYGLEVRRQPEQALHWLRAAAGQGCEVSAYMQQRLPAGQLRARLTSR